MFSALTCALGVCAAIVRAEFVPAAQNLSADVRQDHADFNQIFGQSADVQLLDAAGPIANRPIAEYRDFGMTSGSNLGPDTETAVQAGAIQVPDLLRVRTSHADPFGEISTAFSLVGDDVNSACQARDPGWSGHSYAYHAFSSEYQRLSGSEAVTLVPTPTALQGGIAGLLLVIGITSYIRRRARMKAHQRTG